MHSCAHAPVVLLSSRPGGASPSVFAAPQAWGGNGASARCFWATAGRAAEIGQGRAQVAQSPPTLADSEKNRLTSFRDEPPPAGGEISEFPDFCPPAPGGFRAAAYGFQAPGSRLQVLEPFVLEPFVISIFESLVLWIF